VIQLTKEFSCIPQNYKPRLIYYKAVVKNNHFLLEDIGITINSNFKVMGY